MSEATGTEQHDEGRSPPDPRHVHPHHGPLPMAAIAVGGALGTLARYVLERAMVPAPTGFPWATFAANVVGSFILAVVVTLALERWPGDRVLRPLVAVGFCGGFTTFSTFAVEVDQRVRAGHTGVAAVYTAASLLAGVAAVLAGAALGRGRLIPPAGGPEPVDPDLLAGDEEDG